jgi:hypothetical protein
LLPYKFKIPGLICIAVAVILTAIYFYYSPRLAMPVFAIVSSYIETKLFATFITNFFEELILLTFISGFSLVVFSEEKVEKRCLKIVRLKALRTTIAIYIFWLLLSVIFIFGNAYIATLLVNIIFPFNIYLASFYLIKYRELNKARLRHLQNELAKSVS